MKRISRKEALARGLKRYFTGKSCPAGHVCERIVSCFACVRCSRIARDEWYKTPAGRRSIAKSNRGPGREAQRRYRGTPKCTEKDRRSNNSPKGTERMRRFNSSPKGTERMRRYLETEHGRDKVREQRERRRERYLARFADMSSPEFNPVRAQRIINGRRARGEFD
jgi:hypothetical protein